MPKEPGRRDRSRNGRKALLAIAVAARLLAVAVLRPQPDRRGKGYHDVNAALMAADFNPQVSC